MNKTEKALQHLKEGKLSKLAIANEVGCQRSYIYELIERYHDEIHTNYHVKHTLFISPLLTAREIQESPKPNAND